jgi:hypothetical protein
MTTQVLHGTIAWRCDLCAYKLEFKPHDENLIDFFTVHHLLKEHGMTQDEILQHDAALGDACREYFSRDCKAGNTCDSPGRLSANTKTGERHAESCQRTATMEENPMEKKASSQPLITRREGRFRISLWRRRIIYAPEGCGVSQPGDRVGAQIQHNRYNKASNRSNSQTIWCDCEELIDLRRALDVFGHTNESGNPRKSDTQRKEQQYKRIQCSLSGANRSS